MSLSTFEPGTFRIQVTSVIASTKLLGVNADKTKHMLVSRHQNAGQNQLKYSEMTATNETVFMEKLRTD
jgi:hypothetical protein